MRWFDFSLYVFGVYLKVHVGEECTFFSPKYAKIQNFQWYNFYV